ncbi:hypothetical protein ACFY8P_35010 [Streptomyces sp. NPDC012693]|jgi:hypothetical protein|uniref:hypothetical protein n=1 Tax=unclassified Streptomyces TaxID=2593676 RepID=UPI00202FD71A|nr:hypothetical protein [Streptomyces sp. MSC1_001]
MGSVMVEVSTSPAPCRTASATPTAGLGMNARAIRINRTLATGGLIDRARS